MQLATAGTGTMETWLFAVLPGIPQQSPAHCQGDPVLAGTRGTGERVGVLAGIGQQHSLGTAVKAAGEPGHY